MGLSTTYCEPARKGCVSSDTAPEEISASSALSASAQSCVETVTTRPCPRGGGQRARRTGISLGPGPRADSTFTQIAWGLRAAARGERTKKEASAHRFVTLSRDVTLFGGSNLEKLRAFCCPKRLQIAESFAARHVQFQSVARPICHHSWNGGVATIRAATFGKSHTDLR